MGDFNSNPFWPVWFRILQTAFEAAPTILCGLVVAGLIRGLVRPAWLRQVFTNDPNTGPVRACAIGFLLPVCSLGVLPVAWELKRAGVPRATVLTFLLSAPITNLISLISALQKLGPQGALAISAFLGLVVLAYLIVTGIGILSNKILPERMPVSADLPLPPNDASSRLLILGLVPAWGLTGVLALFLIVGLVGSGLLALYPGGALERAANDRSQFATLHMALAAFPAELPPAQGAALACDMLLAGDRLGLVFVFLVVGIGINLASPLWIAWTFGVRTSALLFGLLFAMTVLVGYVVPHKLPGLPSDLATDSRFLEIEVSGGAELARTRALEDTLIDERGDRQWLQIGACAALAVLALAGIVCRVIGAAASPEVVLANAPSREVAAVPTSWTVPLTGPQLGLAGLVVSLIVVVGGLYLVYPAPGATLDDMNSVQVELNLTLKKAPIAKPLALNLIGQWQRLQGKLVFGDFLRRGRFNSPLRQPSEELRAGIQKLRTMVTAESSPEELAAVYLEARKAADRCRQAAGA